MNFLILIFFFFLSVFLSNTPRSECCLYNWLLFRVHGAIFPVFLLMIVVSPEPSSMLRSSGHFSGFSLYSFSLSNPGAEALMEEFKSESTACSCLFLALRITVCSVLRCCFTRGGTGLQQASIPCISLGSSVQIFSSM